MSPTDPPIHIPRHLVNQILHLAQSSGEIPVKALLGAKDGILTSCHPVYQVEGTGADADPSKCDAVLLAMQQAGESLFAVVHSNQDMSAQTSERKAFGGDTPGILQLIVSLDTKGVLEMRAYQPSPGSPKKEVELSMTD